ncbi:MAG: T9SS type A sorting domain-containing protein [Saprospiraceae bacterium]|nr:T9SS type A sorting domain-containing protein [Candidatus Defluviibacterium haderslevense]
MKKIIRDTSIPLKWKLLRFFKSNMLFFIISLNFTTLFSQFAEEPLTKDNEQKAFDKLYAKHLSSKQILIGSNLEDMVLNYVDNLYINTNPKTKIRNNLKLNFIKIFNGQSNIYFNQTYKGIEVEDKFIVAKVDSKNRLLNFVNNYKDLGNFDIKLNKIIIEDNIKKIVYDNFSNLNIEKIKLVIDTDNNIPSLIYKIYTTSPFSLNEYLLKLNAYTGQKIGADLIELQTCSKYHNSEINHNGKFKLKELSLNNNKIDRKITSALNLPIQVDGIGTVFDPTPTYTAKTAYGVGNFIDNSDASNSDLVAQQRTVVLKGIENNNGIYKLKGDFVEVDNYGPANHSLYEQTSPDFSCNRGDDQFEAVMCYYHLDKNLRRIKDDLNISGVEPNNNPLLRFEPFWSESSIGAIYNPTREEIVFGGGNVDLAEDAGIILHELGHGISFFVTNDNITRSPGVAEGIADFWNVSNNRDCTLDNVYPETSEEYNVSWGDWGAQPTSTRRTNKTTRYTPNLNNGGQEIFTSALFKILRDIGREKTQKLIIWSFPRLVGVMNIRTGATEIYKEAFDRYPADFSLKDLCSIFSIFDKEYDLIDPNDTEVIYPDSPSDVYMKDTECDFGEEVNPDNGPMWISRDIWVRNTNDNGLDHQNPEFKTNSPNYVYVRVRAKGCQTSSIDGLHVYFSKASTKLKWPDTWVNYYITGLNGQPVLAGNEITPAAGFPITSLTSGSNDYIGFPWYPPNPAEFATDNHHFCLLARLVDDDDAMYIQEGNDVNINTKNNNNIVWKNISVFDDAPNFGVYGPNSVYIGCEDVLTDKSFTLKIKSAKLALGKSIADFGEVTIELLEPLKSIWLNQSNQGQGFSLNQDGNVKVLNDNFILNFNGLTNCNPGAIKVYYKPNIEGSVSFDLIQTNSHGTVLGGERFEYNIPNLQNQLKKPDLRTSTKNEPLIQVFPTNFDENIYVKIRSNENTKKVYIFEIFDISGKPILKYNNLLLYQNTEYKIDLRTLEKGVYIIKVLNSIDKSSQNFKIIKI